MREKARDFGFDCLELQPKFDEQERMVAPAELSTDGIHPTTLGHRVIAQAVLQAMEEKRRGRAR